MTRNVALLCLDTVRKDVFDEFAPRLGDSGVSFDQCRAASSWSVPSHASMLTGELPHRHGVHSFNRDFSTLDRADTFLGDLPVHRAIGASANVYASAAFGFDSLFDDFSNVAPQRRFPEGLDVGRFAHDFAGSDGSSIAAFCRAALNHPHPLKSLLNGVAVKLNDLQKIAPLPKLFDDGARIVARETNRLIAETEEPFFLFANFMDAHPPLQHTWGYDRGLHSAPNSWTSAGLTDEDVRDDAEVREYYRGVYSAAVDYLDRTVSQLVQNLRDATDRELTVVITSDHGQNLGIPEDDGLVGHVKSSLTEGVLHVPLCIIDPPTDYEASDGYISHLDLGELVVGLADGKWPEISRNRITAEAVGIGDADPTLDDDDDPRWDRTVRCAYEGETKYEWDSLGNRLAFELDPERPNWQRCVDETADVPAWATELFDGTPESYREQVATTKRVDPDVGPAIEERLSDLGYL